MIVYVSSCRCCMFVSCGLSGFSVRLFCFVQAKTVCGYGCMHFLAALVLVCVDVMVMSSGWAMT